MLAARLGAVLPVVGAAAAPVSPTAGTRHPVSGNCSPAGERITLTASARLDERCTYTGGVEITRSHVDLDCGGAVIDGTGRSGVGIEVSTLADVDLTDVTIRHCVVRGYLNSIRVTRVGFRTLGAGHEYDHRLSGVRIDHNDVSGSQGVGVFVDGYVTRTNIRHTSIRGAGSTGIYLEAVALALEEPGSPVTPTPDLTVPTLGALPRCP